MVKRKWVNKPEAPIENQVAALATVLQGISALQDDTVPPADMPLRRRIPNLDRRGSANPERRAQLAARRKAAAERRQRVRDGKRARRRPWILTAATAATGTTAWGIKAFVEMAAGIPGVLVSLASAVAVAGTAGVIYLANKDRIDQRWRHRYALASTVAMLWVAITTATGVNLVLLCVLLLAAVCLSAGWWRTHRINAPAAHPAAASPIEEIEEITDRGQVVKLWQAKVAATHGPLPKALLTDGKDLEHGFTWTVQTDENPIEFSAMLNKRGAIAARLKTRVTNVQLDPHPSGDESMATLTVLTRNILEEGVPYPGPRYHNGRIPIGPHVDGSGDAEFVIYDSAGCYGGLLSGEPRSGKSSCFENVGLSLCASGEWVVFYCDGDQTGGSSPVMNEFMHWPLAGVNGALQQLRALEGALEARGVIKPTMTEGQDGKPVPLTDPTTQHPAKKLLPCPSLPGIVWMIDELHRLTKDPDLKEHRWTQRLESLVRIGPKYGIVVITASHSLLAGDYGNSTTLRGYLAARNVFAFRNQNKVEKATLNGLQLSPAALPAGGGYAYSTGSGRLAMLRSAYSNNMAAHGAGLPNIDLDDDTTLGLNGLWTKEARDPETVAREAQHQLTEWRRQRRDGDHTSIGALTLTPTPATPTDKPTFATSTVLQLRKAIPPALTAADIIRAPHQRGRLSEDARAVLAVIEDGHLLAEDRLTKTATIKDSTAFEKNRVHEALRELLDRGLVTQPKKGFYQLTYDLEHTA